MRVEVLIAGQLFDRFLFLFARWHSSSSTLRTFTRLAKRILVLNWFWICMDLVGSKWSYLFRLVGITRTRLHCFFSCTRSTCYRRRWISALRFTIYCLVSRCCESNPFWSHNLVIVLYCQSESTICVLFHAFQISLIWKLTLVPDRLLLGSIVWGTTTTS